ncbi:putative toxin-antitoxin system toxin component, PIN family [Mucilaginibacter sp. FT3.2]|uniref:putative toxin-antitoxin system toxin component, PIN family n=1 Tax=Mucilaginibacter sp. FT3.2 TaxID=2723090 RepID=UPI00161925E1|nr:putative toxin-antitoxin system toxin component, PIN family [Mucilaginibacter sp. FT3.2]MBB6229957.1 putative PIN family toxin of toxin-antitoxin system [Mucilaginibacter sp. FT3.2]
MTKTKYFVLDANTLISAFLLAKTSIAARAFYKASSEGTIVLSDETYAEFSDVFIRPKFDRYVPFEKRLAIIEDLKSIVKFVAITIEIQACRDTKDNKYLELAISSVADCIITGDKDLLVLHPFQNIPILTAGDFLEKN